MTSHYYIRVNTRPEEDLKRGYSYTMGNFGNEDEAHDGLSGYSLRAHGIDAVHKLADRMGIYEDYPTGVHVTLFRGWDKGSGPDMEDLFGPEAIVASWEIGTFGEDAEDARHALAILIARALEDEAPFFAAALQEDIADEWEVS